MDFPIIEQSFTESMEVAIPQSYFGLRRHLKETKDPFEKYFKKIDKQKE
jgi:hypothetical protein